MKDMSKRHAGLGKQPKICGKVLAGKDFAVGEGKEKQAYMGCKAAICGGPSKY